MTTTTGAMRQLAEQRSQIEQQTLGQATTVTALPVQVDLVLYRGDDFYLDIAVTDSSNAALPMTGKTPAAQIKAADTDPAPLASFTCTVDTTTTNIIHLHLANADSALLPDAAVWDCQITDDSSNDILTLVSGAITTSGDVTRP